MAKRTPADVEILISAASQRDWLYVQKESGLSRKEVVEDEGVLSVFLAYLADKQENGASNIGRWLDATQAEVVEFLDIDDSVTDDPKASSTPN